MQSAVWINLFRRIPTAQHDTMILMTTVGAEIVLQRVIRLDRDFLVCQGRLSGCTDEGKLLIIPYDQMTYVSFAKKMTDAEIQSMVGKPGVVAPGTLTAPAAEPEPEEMAEIVEEMTAFAPELTAEPVALAPLAPAEVKQARPAKPGPKVPPPSKTILLARLRQRLAGDIAKQGDSGKG